VGVWPAGMRAAAGSQHRLTLLTLLLHMLHRHFVCLTIHLENASKPSSSPEYIRVPCLVTLAMPHACTVMSAESLASSEEVKQLELRVHEAMGTAPEQGHVSFVELHVRRYTC
jgi:hypothetical protein